MIVFAVILSFIRFSIFTESKKKTVRNGHCL